MKPPAPVTAAVALIAISFALGPLTVLLSSPQVLATGFGLLITLFSLGLAILVLRALYVGRNWVRWVCLFLTVTTIVYLPWSFKGNSVLDLWQTAFQAVAAVLLLLPASNRWYGPNNSVGSKPLRAEASALTASLDGPEVEQSIQAESVSSRR